MTYEEASELTRSEKISLVTCEAAKPVKLFNHYQGFIYYKEVDYFVSNVYQYEVNLEVVFDIESLSPGTWFYDSTNKKVYIWTVGDVDPKFTTISIIFKFFFSNAPLILPHDLNNGFDVEWLPIITNIGSIGQQLDDENIGIVLESQSNVEFINQGYFDNIFDSLIWENKEIKFYSWFRGIPITEAKNIFNGVVESKDFSPEKVNFKVKDYVFKLKNFVNLGSFSDLDGDILESIIGTPKRRIYGQVKQAQAIPIDCIKDGFPLTGTISLVTNSDIITGLGTLFLNELKQGDTLKFIYNNEIIKYEVDLVSSDTFLKLSKKSDESLSDISVTVDPVNGYRFKNRRWHLAGHRIRQSETEILNVINARTFIVNSISEFYSGDVVKVNNVSTQITRVSGNQIILEQNIFPIPVAGNIISRFPITSLFFKSKNLIPFRDFTLTNSTEAIIELEPLAEFNIAREYVSDNNLKFNHLSYEVNSISNADLRTIISPGDWIRPTVQNNDTWYEVSHVGSNIVYLKTAFNQGGGNSDHPARIKKIELIQDDSIILADCYGYDRNGSWMRTASDCVKHLVENDAQFLNVDNASFEQAGYDCHYILSMVIPENPGSQTPLIRDVISKINDSVFGSLYGNSSQEISFSIVNTRRPESLRAIKDDDIISWDIKSSQKIVNKVKINYSPFVDKISGENGYSVVNYNNDFVNNYVGIRNTIEKVCYLFNEQDAQAIAQRTAFYYSLSQSILTLKAKANFFTSSVNDRIYVDLERIYTRYGGTAGRKIGVVSGIKKSPYNSEIIMNDLGNIFNRCHTFAPSTTPSFTLSDDDEKIKYGFLLDGDTLTPDPASEDELGSHLLG